MTSEAAPQIAKKSTLGSASPGAVSFCPATPPQRAGQRASGAPGSGGARRLESRSKDLTQAQGVPALKTSRRFRYAAAAASLVLATSIATSGAGQDQKTAPAQDEEAFARAGEELVEKVCSECHGLEDVTRMRRTGRDWNETVLSMATKGANATDDQFATIKKYLTRYYGMVLVNSASAQDLSAVLGLSATDANAIVEYRQAHGKFADLDALAKVPGIDKTKIEAQPEALRFE